MYGDKYLFFSSFPRIDTSNLIKACKVEWPWLEITSVSWQAKYPNRKCGHLHLEPNSTSTRVRKFATARKYNKHINLKVFIFKRKNKTMNFSFPDAALVFLENPSRHLKNNHIIMDRVAGTFPANNWIPCPHRNNRHLFSWENAFEKKND